MVENVIFWKKWIQPDTATFSCQLIVLLVAQPVANIPKFWRDWFVFFCGTLSPSISLWFIVQYLWWKCNSLKNNTVRHSHSYLPFDSVAICTTCCYIFENLKRQFCFYDGTSGLVIFLEILIQYLWWEMQIVKKNSQPQLSAITLAVDFCVAIFSACCSYFKIMKRQFCYIYSILAKSSFFRFVIQYWW